MVKFYGIIYYALNLINDKIYIGQTTGSLKQRKSSHYCNAKYDKKNNHFYNALKKYKKADFEWNIIDVAYCKDELDAKECNWIMLFDSLESGYNIRKGGSNGKFSDETRKKMSIARLGKSPWNKGKKATPEACKNQGIGRLGINKGSKSPFAKAVIQLDLNNNFIAKYDTITEAEKELDISHISCVIIGKRKTAGGFHWKYADGSSKPFQPKKRKIRNILGVNNPRARAVIQLDLNNNFITEYDTLTEASNKTNIKLSNISLVCNGKRRRKTAGGFHWQYVKKQGILNA